MGHLRRLKKADAGLQLSLCSRMNLFLSYCTNWNQVIMTSESDNNVDNFEAEILRSGAVRYLQHEFFT